LIRIKDPAVTPVAKLRAPVSGGDAMTEGEIAYLAMVVVAMLTFMGALVWVQKH
jgi:hypothetical protein